MKRAVIYCGKFGARSLGVGQVQVKRQNVLGSSSLMGQPRQLLHQRQVFGMTLRRPMSLFARQQRTGLMQEIGLRALEQPQFEPKKNLQVRWFWSDENDLYRILEVDKNATAKDIKMAYYKLAKKYHPDISKEPNARVIFHKIAAAYEVLSDPVRRRHYDMTGQHDNQQHFNQSYSSAYANTTTDDFADRIFRKVWQDLGVQEYISTVRSEASTALEAARHGDYSFAWEFAKERKGLIISTLLPIALLLRFPGAIGVAARFVGLAAIVAARSLPPEVAWHLLKNVWIRIVKR